MINEDETYVRMTKTGHLVEKSDVAYDRQYLIDQSRVVGTELDEVELIDSEEMVSLSKLKERDADLYNEVHAAITSALTSTFRITIEETLCRTIEVKAASSDDAIDIVAKQYHDGDIVLDESDFDGDTVIKDLENE